MKQTNVLASNTMAACATSPDTVDLAIREFLVFKLGDAEYSMVISRVQEIHSYEPLTRMANTPASIKHWQRSLAGHRLDSGSHTDPARHRKLMSSGEMGLISTTVH